MRIRAGWAVLSILSLLAACGEGGVAPLRNGDTTTSSAEQEPTGVDSENASSDTEQSDRLPTSTAADPVASEPSEPVTVTTRAQLDSAMPTTIPTDSQDGSVASQDSPVTGQVPGSMMSNVLAAAAEYSGVDESSIVIVRAQAVTWGDGSLGCPEPGMVYTQVLVNGYWVELSAGGLALDYRLNDRGDFKRCASGSAPLPPADT